MGKGSRLLFTRLVAICCNTLKNIISLFYFIGEYEAKSEANKLHNKYDI